MSIEVSVPTFQSGLYIRIDRVSADIPNGATVMSNYARESQRFAREILVPLAHVFKVSCYVVEIVHMD
jgi:hypothetical protein